MTAARRLPLLLLAAIALLLATSPASDAAPSRGVPSLLAQPAEGEEPPQPEPPEPSEGEGEEAEDEAEDEEEGEPPAPSGQPTAEQTAEEPEDEDEKWDVTAPPGPREEVTLDVREGTWMSLDVSPDGREIVFDLMGDLYTLPIGGGEARALTSDIAWQMQPRYSPDGRHIAFASDQGGGDNLWIMDRDGSNPRQVSKESFRLLTQPEWTPDGEFLVGRKHFTSTRSAGAGEMWLYHRSGGDGLQMTKKRTEQKDTGEPAFSPDGRYLYYSDDVTPGEVFEYRVEGDSV